MRISNITIRIVLACACAGPVSADNLTLSGESSRMTGTVRSINEEGVVELATPLSPAPVMLKSGAVKKVEFSGNRESPELPPALVELINGDILPAAVESFDDRKLTVISPDAGRLEIARDALRSVQLGVQRRKMIYSGPRNLEEWAAEGDVKNWMFERNSLVANGPATATRKIELPKQFVLRFTLGWQAHMIPNFVIYFADPLKPKGEPADRYFLRFNSAGFGIQREATKGKHFNPIVELNNRTPNQYPDHQLEVEIRADRQGSRLQLFLNGEPEGWFIDPIDSVPTGSAITLVCNAQNGNPHEIRGIEVFELNDSRTRHRAEDRGDPKNDYLISRDDQRWGGRLMEIRTAGAGQVFVYKSDFQKDVLEIPETEVSTVFFAVKNDGKPAGEARPFVLRLRGEGALRVASCRFTENAVTAVHPLLGPLEFRRDGILAMERTDLKPEPEPEP